jgi:hypothetical protein
MSWEAAQRACCLAYREGGAALKAVYCVIAGHANHETGRWRISDPQLAAEAWISVSTAQRATRKLEKLGAIRACRANGRAPEYEIIPDWKPPTLVNLTEVRTQPRSI